MTSITIGTPKRMTKWYLAAACGVALALAAIAAIAVRSAAKDSSGVGAGTVPATGSVATQAHSRTAIGPSEVVYLVSSQEQADAARAAIDQAAALSAPFGSALPNMRVVVEGTDDADFLVATLNDMKLPGVSLIDLRAHE